MKNKSISRRLFIIMVLVIAAFSAMLLAANSLLLKPLYYNSVQSNMEDAMTALIAIDYTQESTDWSTEVISVGSGRNMDITIEEAGEVIYSSSMDIGIKSGPEDFFDKEPREDLPDIHDRREPRIPFYRTVPESEWTALSGDMTMASVTEPDNRSEMFVLQGQASGDISIYIMQSVEPVLQSVRQANILLAAIAGIFLIITAIVALSLSKNFTKPIRQMQAYVGQLSELDFDVACSVETGDELQSLNEDIRLLANRLKDALGELKDKNKQLEREIKAQRKFISNASHELRTPLSLIKGYADEITAGFVVDRDQEHRYVGYIVEETAKMKRLLNEILELSRLESGRMTYEPHSFSVDEAIEDFIDKYDGFIEEHNLDLEMHLDPCVGIHDHMRFEQILANYLSNAAKYADSRKKVRITCESMEDRIRVEVFNTGAPIDEETIPNLWRSFFKADEARSVDSNSYGLGLSIVKAIQDMAGWTCGTENVEDGVIFWFDLAKAKELIENCY